MCVLIMDQKFYGVCRCVSRFSGALALPSLQAEPAPAWRSPAGISDPRATCRRHAGHPVRRSAPLDQGALSAGGTLGMLQIATPSAAEVYETLGWRDVSPRRLESRYSPTRRGGWSDVTRQLAAEAGEPLLANSPRRLESRYSPTRRGGWSDVTRQLAAEAGEPLLANSPAEAGEP